MDTISRFCTHLRNAIMAKHQKVDVPSSHLQKGVAQKLKEAGYIKNYIVVEDGKQGFMRIYLKYNSLGNSVITRIDRVSKPSCRQYVRARHVPSALSGHGLVVLSTSKGILSDKEARERNIGGEVLCRVW